MIGDHLLGQAPKNLKKILLVAAAAPVGCLATLWIVIMALASLATLLNLHIAPPAEIREGWGLPSTPANK